MLKVKNQQMTAIKKCLGKSLEIQRKVFDELAYSNSAEQVFPEGKSLNVVQVIHNDEYMEIRDEIKNYPEDYDIFSEDRGKDIKLGAVLSEEEETTLHDYIFEENTDNFISVTEISDELEVVFCLLLESDRGQLGFEITDFFGFYSSEDEANIALGKLPSFVF